MFEKIKGNYIKSYIKKNFIYYIYIILLFPTQVYAQITGDSYYSGGWLSDRQYQEGPGIAVGDSLVFHPGLGVEGGYDTNALLLPEDYEGAGRLRVDLNLDLATRPPQREGDTVAPHKLDFRFGVAGFYNEYLSDNTTVSDRRNFNLEANLDLTLFPQNKFSFFIRDIFVRQIEPRYDVVNGYSLDLDRNEAKIGFNWNPGTAFTLSFNYGFIFNYYENSGDVATLGNRMEHEINLDTKWKFLPKTALVFHGQFVPILHMGDGTTSSGYLPNNSYNARGKIGLVGLLTPRFSVLAEIGYGTGFYDDNVDVDTIIARAELNFSITPFIKLSFGYDRDFRDSLWGNYFIRDMGYLAYSHLIAGRVLINLKGGFSYFSYADLTIDNTLYQRRDPVAEVSLFVEYRIQDWLAINATVNYSGNFTSFELNNNIPSDYQQVLLLAGIRTMY